MGWLLGVSAVGKDDYLKAENSSWHSCCREQLLGCNKGDYNDEVVGLLEDEFGI